MTTLAPILTSKMTVEQYFQLGEDPPGVHLELINGEIIVSPSPSRTHQQIILALAYLVEGHLRKTKLGSIYLDTDVVFEEDTVRRPDISFYGTAKLKRMKGERLLLPPDLCVEVLSPFNEDDDRINKFNLYRKHRVGHYWIVDPETKTAECFKLRAGQYTKIAEGSDDDTVHFPPFSDLAIPLAELWYGNR
jgi:Uma2 family endonuclease